MAGSLEEVELWLDRAEETLKASKALRDRGFYKDAVSRAYYAMFYAAKAAVVKEGVRGKKHSGVISAFGRLFAKTGRLEARLHRTLMAAYRQREETDYRPKVVTSKEAATETIQEAEEFVAVVGTFLKSMDPLG